MLNFLEDTVGLDYAPIAFWTIIALIAILVFLILFALLRRMRSGTYVVGGRNRKARLSVMDATAVDTHRRLVLVRRDDVEHLLLIGGNSDIVVERDIRPNTHARRPAPQPEAQIPMEEAPAPQPRPAPAAPRPYVSPSARPAPPASRPAPAPVPPSPRLPPPVSARPSAKTREDLDNDLMKELESAMDIDDPAPKARPSLDDEMSKLLGELTNQKR